MVEFDEIELRRIETERHESKTPVIGLQSENGRESVG